MQDQLYREIILEHWKNPHNYGVISGAAIDVVDTNKLCGDSIRITMEVKNNKIEHIMFTSGGCAISKASASMLTDLVHKKAVSDVKKITPENFLELLEIELTPARTKCALLSYSILQNAIK
ncbi:MAG TPA: iron-sulfur cluster assembly scaffold protein [Patescibacteria group bacterium]